MSVIVSAYNQCETLRVTLRTLSAQVVKPSIKWEHIVVDNNSKDNTKRVYAVAAQGADLLIFIHADAFSVREYLARGRNKITKYELAPNELK